MAKRITTSDKVGLVEKKVHENQYWDSDYNEQKTVINSHADDIETNASDIADLTAAQSGGLKSFKTLALLQAYATPDVNDSYKVTNDDIDSDNNGYYHWVSGTTYEKDYDLVNGVIEEGNIDAVSGGRINNVTSKKADLIVGKNKFNKDTVTEDYAQGSSGWIFSTTSYDLSDYIEVVEGQDYIGSSLMRYTCYFDEDKNVVTGGSDSQISTFTIPSGVKYIRVTLNAGVFPTFQFEEGATETDYEAYKLYVDPTQILTDETDEPIIAEYNNNAFDYSNVQEGYRYDLYSNSLIEDSAYVASLFYFPVEEGDILRSVLNYGESSFTGQYYDEDKNYLSGALFNSSILEKTVPANAKYVRFSCKTANRLIKLITKNTTELKYEKAGLFSPSEYDVLNKSMFNGMIYNSVGDSITAQIKWQGYLITKYGLEWRNKGSGGQRMSGSNGMWFTSFDSGNSLEIDSDIDLVTLNFGANDWLQNAVIGSQDSTNTDEILGAFNSYVNSFYTTFPTKILIVIGTTLCAESGSFTNTLGYTTRDISEAIKERCLYFGIPFADVISNYGINEYNYTNFSNDEIHPNDLGAERMAGVIIGIMESIDNYKN